MEKKKILLVGESWVTSANHTKGWDTFSSVTFHLGAEPLVDALKDSPFELTYMKAHEAALDFPLSLEGLTHYDAILLSDIGSNTLLLHPDVWLQGRRSPTASSKACRSVVDKVPVSNIGARGKKARRSQPSVRAASKSSFPQLLNRLDEPTGGNLEPTRPRP